MIFHLWILVAIELRATLIKGPGISANRILDDSKIFQGFYLISSRLSDIIPMELASCFPV